MPVERISYRQSLALDHLRWMSALAVVITHTRQLFMGEFEGTSSLALKAFKVFSGFGSIAVVIFFVMSGMLVGGKVLTMSLDKRDHAAKYIADRASRILFVAYPALLFAFILNRSLIFYYGDSYGQEGYPCAMTWGDLVTHALFLNNAFFASSCFISPYWSLHNEVFYYALWPLVVVAWTAKLPSTRIICGAVAALVIAALLATGRFDHHATLPYAATWLVGILALVPSVRRLAMRAGSWLLGAALAVSLVLSRTNPFGFYLTDVFVALVGVAYLASLGGWSEWTAPPWFERFGRWAANWSFSLYLFHWSTLMALRTVLERDFGMQLGIASRASFAAFLSAFVATLVVSYGAHLIFERRTMMFRKFRFGSGQGRLAEQE